MGAEFSKHVDKLLDETDAYKRAVNAAFSEYAKVLPGSSAPPSVDSTHLLDASRKIIKVLSEDMNTHLRRLCLREPTSRDCEFVLFSLQPRFRRKVQQARQSPPPQGGDIASPGAYPSPPPRPPPSICLDFESFESFSREMVKRVAVDRGRRLLLFVAGGVLVVQMIKGTIRKVPLVGPPVVTLVSAVLPTSVAGPALGITGALYFERGGGVPSRPRGLLPQQPRQ